METSSKNSKTRTHKDVIFRAAVRKHSCSRLLYINIAIMMILLIAIHSCVNFSIFCFMVMSRDKVDKVIMEKFKGRFEHYECPYKKPENYSTEYCSKYCGADSVITRIQYPDTDSNGWYLANKKKSPSCTNRLEMLDCHESLKSNGCLPKRNNMTECAGLPGSKVVTNVDGFAALAPAIGNIPDEWVASNKTVLANELIIQCPTCLTVSKNFSINHKNSNFDGCFVKLSTKNDGWPANFGYCNNVIKISESDACPRINDNL